MLFREFNFDKDEIARSLTIDASKHSPTWEHYYLSYTYTIEKLIEKCLKENYAFNSKSRVIMFLLRHSLELCLKYNLFLRGKIVPLSHVFADLIEAFDKLIIPPEMFQVIKDVNLDSDGSCYRYYRNQKTKIPFFNYKDKIKLFEIVMRYNSLPHGSDFVHSKISESFDYDDRVIQWDLTLHLGECTRIEHIRTQFDETIEFLIDGLIAKTFDISRVCLPLLFSIRHSMELALKSNIIALQQVSPLINSKAFEQEHSLLTLYNCYDNFLSKIDTNKLPEEIQTQLQMYRTKYRELNNAVHNLDVNSRYFRYPVDKHGGSHSINFTTFKLVDILKLYYFTDPFITFTNSILEDNSLIRLDARN